MIVKHIIEVTYNSEDESDLSNIKNYIRQKKQEGYKITDEKKISDVHVKTIFSKSDFT